MDWVMYKIIVPYIATTIRNAECIYLIKVESSN